MISRADVAKGSFKPVFSGVLAAFMVLLISMFLLGCLTEFGWTGTIQWSDSLYLVIIYLSIIFGSVTAGLKSHQSGWLTGAGVGFFSSILLILLALGIGEKIYWPLFLGKLLLNTFIGAFGGIIGVNLTGKEL